jgi:hypothetical protein
MEKENIKKILNDAAADRNRQLTRWRYHVAKHPEKYDEYIKLKEKLNNEKKELLQQMEEHIKKISKENKLKYFKKYYEENKENIKMKAREYSREKYYPKHREEKIAKVKANQEKKKGELTEENIYFPKII